MQKFLGIDWGGTYVKVGIVTDQGRISKKLVYDSKELRHKDIFLEHLKLLIEELHELNIKGVGIGAPGIVNVEQGFIYYLPNIPGWQKYPLKTVLERKLKLPVFVNNDAKLFALAESTYGAARGKKRSVFLTLGTGLGGAVVIGGKLLDTTVSALELGHVPLSIDGELCSCGGRGCIETFVGNRYLLKRYAAVSGAHEHGLTVKDLYERGRAGEKEALTVWKDFSRALGMFLSGIINIFNPEVIVFGGGVSGAFPLFKPMVLEAIKRQAMWPNLAGLKLVRAKLDDAGIIGAALFARQCKSNRLH